jgi:hypothetical protein
MTSLSKLLAKPLAALSILAAIVGSLGVTSLQAGCASTCSDSETAACNNTFTACITAAAAAGGAGCQKCADDYCACYDKCGSTCDKGKVSGSCSAGGG